MWKVIPIEQITTVKEQKLGHKPAKEGHQAKQRENRPISCFWLLICLLSCTFIDGTKEQKYVSSLDGASPESLFGRDSFSLLRSFLVDYLLAHLFTREQATCSFLCLNFTCYHCISCSSCLI